MECRPLDASAEHDVAGRDALGAEDVGVLDDAGGGAGDVVLVGLEQARVLGGLAADEGDPRLLAGRGDAATRCAAMRSGTTLPVAM